MGKRSEFERKPRDFYPTPFEAVEPLTPHLPKLGHSNEYWEPCCGDGQLVGHLLRWGFKATGWSDIEPQCSGAWPMDARTLKVSTPLFITNPPWDRPILHAIIENLRTQALTWLLIDADWAHTKQAKPYLPYCSHIVAIGRVKWIPGSKHTGKDNCCWYRFVKSPTATTFIGR